MDLLPIRNIISRACLHVILWEIKGCQPSSFILFSPSYDIFCETQYFTSDSVKDFERRKKKSNLAADIAQFSLLFHSKKKKCGPFLFNTHPSRLEWKAKLTACKGSHRNPPTQKPAYVMVESRLCSWHILWTIVLWLENLQDLFFSFLFFFPF